MFSFIEYAMSNYKLIIELTFQHLSIAFLSVGGAILIGIPLGLLISKFVKLKKPVLATSSVIQAIPSLALMGIFIPIIGIGNKTAIVIIAMYAVLPILRNTYAGLSNVDPSIIQAARGIGMTEWQILFKVKLPMALPVIMAGIRVAAVNSVSTATIAAFIGGGGLGKQIQAGIQIINTNMILSGAIPACLLALLMDYVFGVVERAVVPISLSSNINTLNIDEINKIKHSRRNQLIVIFTCISLLVCNLIIKNIDFGKEYKITIGTTEYIEERIVSQLYAQIIEDRTDVRVELNNTMGSTLVLWEAIKANEIQGIPGYTGTYYATVLGLPVYKNMQADDIYNDVSNTLKDFGCNAVGQLGPNNQYVFAVKPELAQKYNLKTVGDLTSLSKDMVVGCSPSFYSREADGLIPVCKEYGLEFKDALTFGAAPMYLALMNDEVDVIVTYRTDGLLQKYDLVFLEDDHGFFPPYVLFMMLDEDVVNEHPEIKEACLELQKVVSDKEMQDLNFRGAQNGEDPYIIAREFLIKKSLIKKSNK